jgi:UDP-N-acetylglucosamine 2-epimerase (non-hydrolysing)
MADKIPVAIVLGTRPEAIKMAPVVKALARSQHLKPYLISTGQQRELSRQALSSVNLVPDVDLDLMGPNQTLASLTSKVIASVFSVLSTSDCRACLVHGDTTTAFSGAIASFYAKIRLGHVEAGLRTYDYERPWPEEMNRRLIDPLCHWCFAPTELSANNLRAERIDSDKIFVTGNTVIDALLECRNRAERPFVPEVGQRLVLVTGHRRESFGNGFLGICSAILRLVEKCDDVVVIYPVHLNPNVAGPVFNLLGGHPRIRLQEPVAYEAFVGLMEASHFILTDSGGVQEEAPSLGKPVLVMRDTTERPEGIDAGTCELVGTDPERILGACLRLLENESEYARRSALRNPYGDGLAAGRIVATLERDLVGESKKS